MSLSEKTLSSTEINKIIGGNIRRLRLERGLLLKEVCVECGLSFTQHLSMIESGSRGVSIVKLKRLSDFFKVSMDQLLTP